ncbi:MAG: CvpA family protein [Endomicrobiales bacterium]|nr:CvpA family protein [Endomicrobiales bacterium]
MFNIFDGAVIAIIFLIGIFGFRVGVLMSLFYFIAGFGGAWVAQSYARMLGINYYIVFIVAALLLLIIGFVIKRVVGALFLGWLDKSLGFIMGAIIALWLVISVMYPYTLNMDKAVRKITSASYFSQKVLPWLNNKFPVLQKFSIGDAKNAFPPVKETFKKEE